MRLGLPAESRRERYWREDRMSKRRKKASQRPDARAALKVRQARIRKTEAIEIAGVVRADLVVAREILLVDRANHKRVVLYADADRTVITLHDVVGRKLMSVVAEGKDDPTIDIHRHDQTTGPDDESGAVDSVRLYSSATKLEQVC